MLQLIQQQKEDLSGIIKRHNDDLAKLNYQQEKIKYYDWY